MEQPPAFSPPPHASGSSHHPNPAGLWWLRPGAHAPQRPDPVASHTAEIEGPLHALIRGMEALRGEAAGFPQERRKPTRQNLEEIVAPLMQVVPLKTIETLEADVQALKDKLDASRRAGLDPRALAPIEQGFRDIRVVLDDLKPAESLATFRAAIDVLAERLDQADARQPRSIAAEIENAIGALRDIARLADAKDMLGALAEEVRGLSAKLHRMTTVQAAQPAEPAPAPAEPVAFSIERSLQDINRRLDALQKQGLRTPDENPQAQSPGNPPAQSSGNKTEQDALETAHATLSQLVNQLAENLKAARDIKPAPTDHMSLSGGREDNSRYLYDVANEYDPEFAGKMRLRSVAAHDSVSAHIEPNLPGRTIVIPVKPLMFGALVIILAVVAARVSMQVTDLPLPVIAKANTVATVAPQPRAIGSDRADVEVPDLIRSQAPDHAMASPERLQQSALAIGDQENTGTIGRPVTVPAGSPDAASEPTMPLPTTLPAGLRSEALKGKAAAEYEVGVRLVEGKSVGVNVEEGARWLKRAAKAGVIPAHLWLGSLYEKGHGIEKDLNLARKHYLAAAEKGNAKAMHNLAVLHAEGVDGRRDYKTAVRWFQRAAERGIADSQYNYAILLMRGIGVDQNHQEAYKWFALAALQGDREAARHRDEIGRKLEPGAVAAAQAAVRSFTPQSQPTEAVSVAAPAGGWERTSDESRKTRSGIFARGAS